MINYIDHSEELQPKRKSYVYRCKNSENSIIYVGCTSRIPAMRIRAHMTSTLWWSQVVALDWAEFDATIDARLEEEEQIHALHPQYNKLCLLCSRGQRLAEE